MPVTNEDLLNIIKTMHADIQARFEMLDKLVRKHEVKLAVIDHMMETVDTLVDDLRVMAKELQTLKVVSDQHSENWDRMWKYVIGVGIAVVIAAVLGSVLVK